MILKSIRLAESRVEDQIYTGFDSWVDEFRVTILDFDPNTILQVMDEYFLGKGVYKKPKNREDIPDAMINASIMQLLKDKGTLIVILKDGAFKKHLQTVDNINTFESLSEFLGIKDVQSKYSELDSLSENAESIKEYLDSDDFTDNLRHYLIHATEEIEDIYLEESEILSKERLEIDSFGERVEYAQSEHIKDLVVKNSAWLSDDTYSVEITFTTDAAVYYCGNYADYLYLEEDTYRNVSLDSMNGDGICDLSETMSMRFAGLLEIKMSRDLDIEAVKSHSKYLGNEDNPISLSLQIESAEILYLSGETKS